VESEKKARKMRLKTPQELYELWERQHWLSQDIDFSQDEQDWEDLDEEDRDYIFWLLSSFFIGEEPVTTQFSALVAAYEDEEEESFLTTQQVDEARHTQFFDRFYREVVGLEHEGMTGRLERVREELNEAFTHLFDEALVDSANRLWQDPKDREAKLQFITTYHMVIEGTLALTGQHFIRDVFELRNIFPGFTEGFEMVSRDEHRHVAYGTWYLQQAVQEDDANGEIIKKRLQELLPYAAGVLRPPGVEEGEDFEVFGYTSQEIMEFAYNALNRRLKAIGISL
jgi:ribonucleoside-diphosphate reductase beta chain